MTKIIKCIALLLAILLLTACAPSLQNATEPAPTLSDEEILAQRRDLVEAEMRRKMTMLWRSDADITYSHAGPSTGPNNDDSSELLYIKKGRVYQGMPYTHGNSSAEAFLSYSVSQDSKGVYNISGLGSEDMNGNPDLLGFNRARISSDCSSSVFWSWAQISTTIKFDWTRHITEDYGIIRVGTYNAPHDTYKNTKEDAGKNGITVMSAAYAQLQKGDGLVMYVDGSGGHTLMVSQVNVVMKGDQIDPAESYVLVLGQTSSNLRTQKSYYNEQIGEKVYVCGDVDKKFTFKQLCSLGYLPFTCKELIDPSPLPEKTIEDTESNHTKDTILTGTFKCPYRISSVTITIKDSNGNVVQQATGYGIPDEMYRFRLKRLATADEKDVMQGSIDLKALKAGTYTCTHVCRIATGDEITVREFTFTI